MKQLIAVLAVSGLASTALGDARARVFHASPDAPNVDVYVNDGLAFGNLAFGLSTAYASLPGADYNFKVRPAGLDNPVVIDADASLASGVDYTIAAIGTLGGGTLAPLILIDDNSLNADFARVRFVHASPDAPAVDIAVQGGPVLFSSIAFADFGNYLNVGPGSYDLEVRVAGTTNVVLSLAGITFDANTVYTVWALGFAASPGGPGLSAAITVDAVIPAPGAIGLLAAAGLLAARRRR
ncbi:MAG: DUF4397 domain-containing protein [Phycisphaeraceae bacterium]|nr:MAG: DUF4397 domain-containing protein [Phycisphaeraceae bacterium]